MSTENWKQWMATPADCAVQIPTLMFDWYKDTMDLQAAKDSARLRDNLLKSMTQERDELSVRLTEYESRVELLEARMRKVFGHVRSLLEVRDNPHIYEITKIYLGTPGSVVDVWVEHPDYPRKDWAYETSNDETILGYRAWLEIKLDEEDQDESDSDGVRREVPQGGEDSAPDPSG